MKTKVSPLTGFPWRSEWAHEALLIYDLKLEKQPRVRQWIRRFPHRWGVQAGESLKDLRRWPQHVETLAKKSEKLPSRKMKIISVGGGSVGDFAGFMASVYKRGVGLIHIPSTWLAALDSAHGGKTALNVGGSKNQIGTFYPASEVLLVRPLLLSQPPARAWEAGGEVLKMALLKGGAWWKLAEDPRALTPQKLWSALPRLIQGKMSIVQKDPLEKTGHRHLLNLGHTLGHVFESELALPHGVAVASGLAFALIFSRARGFCSESSYEKIISSPLWAHYLPSADYQRGLSLSDRVLRQALLKDKKRDQASRLRFVFLKSAGRPVIESIPVEEILQEVHRQRRLLRTWHGD